MYKSFSRSGELFTFTCIETSKKLLIIFSLTVVYIASSVGIFSSVFLNMHRDSFQESVSQKPANEIKLIFSAAEFLKIQWESKYREFEMNDQWYDVSSIEKTKDGFIVHCVNDSIEEVFVGMVDQWKKSHSPIGKTKILFQPTLPSGVFQLSIQSTFRNETTVFSELRVDAITLPIHSPPPEL